MADGFQGMDEVTRNLQSLPDNIQKRIARAWTRKWSAIAWAAAVQKAPIGRTRNLVAGLVRRDSRARTLGKLRSLARSVVIGRRPAFHFHLVNLGTKPRFTGAVARKGKGGKVSVTKTKSVRASRGIMPKNDFMADAARPLMSQAEADLRVLVQRNLDRFLRRQGG